MAVKSNCFLLAVFSVGVRCLLFLCRCLGWGWCGGQDLAGGLSLRIAAANSVGPSEVRGAAVLDGFPGQM